MLSVPSQIYRGKTVFEQAQACLDYPQYIPESQNQQNPNISQSNPAIFEYKSEKISVWVHIYEYH